MSCAGCNEKPSDTQYITKEVNALEVKLEALTRSVWAKHFGQISLGGRLDFNFQVLVLGGCLAADWKPSIQFNRILGAFKTKRHGWARMKPVALRFSPDQVFSP